MRILITCALMIPGLLSNAQSSDTTIWQVVEEMPRFPGCEELDTTLAAKNQCAQTSLLLFYSANIEYPWQARAQETEGTVVVSFVVEKDGLISNPLILKDIGNGCGEEALRVTKGMNEALKKANLRWVPGKNQGKPVRTKVTVPVRFKLQNPSDFILFNFKDTVYTTVDDSVFFKGGEAALAAWFKNRLRYPPAFRDSCRAGTMDLTVLARPDGSVLVLELTDYWRLGREFIWEAIRATTATWGQWTPATRHGKPVPASTEIRVEFLPDFNQCRQQIDQYRIAESLADEGIRLFNEGKQDEGLRKLNEAIRLFPNNANYRYMRGQAYMNMQKMREACEDFKIVDAMVSIGMVKRLIPVICK